MENMHARPRREEVSQAPPHSSPVHERIFQANVRYRRPNTFSTTKSGPEKINATSGGVEADDFKRRSSVSIKTAEEKTTGCGREDGALRSAVHEKRRPLLDSATPHLRLSHALLQTQDFRRLCRRGAGQGAPKYPA